MTGRYAGSEGGREIRTEVKRGQEAEGAFLAAQVAQRSAGQAGQQKGDGVLA